MEIFKGPDPINEPLSKETLERAISKFKEAVEGHVMVNPPSQHLIVSPTHFPKPARYKWWSKRKRLKWLKKWRAPLTILWRWEKEGLL